MSTSNPYQSLPEKAFWRPAVAAREMLDIDGLWDPKFNIKPRQKVVTFGSCFAQHIGRAMAARGYGWTNHELAPEGLSEEHARAFNYGIFSARTGNIYTTSLLRQWTRWALGKQVAPEEVWETDGRFFDPFRPQIEPDGFASAEEVVASRSYTIETFRKAIVESDVFVFTLGLTESWFDSKTGLEYPMCPGTAAGEFDRERHVFRNQNFTRVLRALRESIELMREANPALKFILTVSPVPLTASNSGNHVLVATSHSKAILRAVAGQLAGRDGVDYFPSYEIISAPPFKGAFFEDNLRSVKPEGVAFVMDSFFRALEGKFGGGKTGKSPVAKKLVEEPHDDVVCEEELLAAFESGAS